MWLPPSRSVASASGGRRARRGMGRLKPAPTDVSPTGDTYGPASAGPLIARVGGGTIVVRPCSFVVDDTGRGRRRNGWQVNPKSCSGAHALTRRFDTSAVCLDDAADNRQSQAEAGSGASRARLALPEGIENEGQEVWCDASSSVSHR